MAPLVVDPRLTAASINTDMPGTDGNGNPVIVSLSASWTGIGPLEHSTVHNNANFPGEGNDNNLRRAARANASVTVIGRTAAGTDSEAVLVQVKSGCVEVARPGVDEFYPCFRVPGLRAGKPRSRPSGVTVPLGGPDGEGSDPHGVGGPDRLAPGLRASSLPCAHPWSVPSTTINAATRPTATPPSRRFSNQATYGPPRRFSLSQLESCLLGA